MRSWGRNLFRRRPRLLLGSAVGVSVLAALAVLAVLLIRPGSATGRAGAVTGGRQAASSAPMQAAAGGGPKSGGSGTASGARTGSSTGIAGAGADAIVSRVVAALGSPAYPLYHRVSRRTVRLANGTLSQQLFDSWFDPGLDRGVDRTWYQGKLGSASARSYAAGTETVLDVDYGSRTWNRYSQPVAAGAAHGGGGLAVIAPEVSAALRGGARFVLLGREQVGGATADHLRAVVVPRGSRGGTITVDIWVDAGGYQLLEATTAGPNPGTGESQATSYQWYGRTAQTLARLTLTVPAGFTQAHN